MARRGGREGAEPARRCWCRTGPATSTCASCCRAAGSRTRAAATRSIEWQWLAELRRGPDRAVGRRCRRDRPGAAGRRRRRARARSPSAWAHCSRAASTSSCSAAACPATRRTCAPRSSSRRACGCRSSPPIRCSSCSPTTTRRTRRGSASPTARCSPTRGASSASAASSTSRSQAQMEALFADLPSALANTVEIAHALQPAPGARQAAAARLRDAAGRRRARADGRVLPHRLARGPRGAAGASSIPTPAARERERPRYVERLEFEIETILKMGFPGYFLIVADFINWAQKQRLPGRPGPRLGRRLAGRLLAQHHRPRSAALQPAVRALPEPGAGVDARLRHRLLPGQPRPRDRLREGEVRPRRGEPDRDLRHDGGEGRAARRRPRARHELRPRRLDRQAGAGAAGQDGDAAQRAARASPTTA